MGLDMYLTRKTFLFPKDSFKVKVFKDGVKYTQIDTEKITSIEEEICYWRKANAIHKWFVDNIQSGKDDCGVYNVSEDEIAELVKTCEMVLSKVKLIPSLSGEYQVIENPDGVADILPTQSGFFFGSTEYDEYYLDDVRRTVETLKPIVLENDNPQPRNGIYDYFYHSSW